MGGSSKFGVCIFATLALFRTVGVPAIAAEVSDPTTGFALVLPQGMSAVRADRPDQAVTFAVRSTRPVPRLPPTSANMCQVGFQPAPQNNALSQAQINEMALSEAGQGSVRSVMERTFRVETLEAFELHGARGLEVVGVPLTGPGAEDVRVVISLLETPNGRATISCATQAADLELGQKAFRELRDGMYVPG